MNICPSIDDLANLLRDFVDEGSASELETHVRECESCGAQLERLLGQDSIVLAIRGGEKTVGSPRDTVDPQMVEVLVPLLKRIQHYEENTGTWLTQSWSTLNSGKSMPMTLVSVDLLLTPSNLPGVLGKLGPYEIQQQIGAGGMGVVFRGRDPRLNRTVAVKIVRPQLLARPEMAVQFVQEAQAAAAVEHDNIVTIYSAEDHNGIPCIVMPLLRGQSLDQRFKQHAGPLPLDEVLRMGCEAASGLAAAHERGLIHRDIKPANLWLEEPSCRVKILDFGLAFARAGDGGSSVGVSGTPGYMAPEQVRGAEIDHRVDLFGLGCVLYRAATGAAPYPATRSLSALLKMLTERPRPIGESNRSLPSDFCRLVDQMLELNPADRPATAQSVVETLKKIQATRGSRSSRVVRRRWMMAGAVAVVLGGVSLAAIVKSPPPVEVKFVHDKSLSKIILLHDGTEQAVDLSSKDSMPLAPGDYFLRTATEAPGHELIPSHVVVLPDEPQTVRLALVGEISSSKSHSGSVVGVGVVPLLEQMTIVSASSDGTLRLWTPGSNVEPKFVDLTSPARCLAVSPSKALAATAGGNKRPPTDLVVQLWNTKTLEPAGEPLEGHTRIIQTAAFSADGKQLLSAAINELFLWDLDARTHRLLAEDATGVLTAVFSSDGKRLLTGSDDGKLILWDAAKGISLRTLVADATVVRAVAFVADGFISVGDEGVIRIWNGKTFAARDMPKQDKAVLTLLSSADGSQFLSGGEDGLLRCWSVTEGRTQWTSRNTGSPILALAWTPDGRQAVSGGKNGAVRVWQLPF